MRNIDELNGALAKITMALASADGQTIKAELERIGEDKLQQDMLAKGEEAVRALGFQQGIGIIKILPELLSQAIKMREKQNTDSVKKRLQI